MKDADRQSEYTEGDVNPNTDMDMERSAAQSADSGMDTDSGTEPETDMDMVSSGTENLEQEILDLGYEDSRSEDAGSDPDFGHDSEEIRSSRSGYHRSSGHNSSGHSSGHGSSGHSSGHGSSSHRSGHGSSSHGSGHSSSSHSSGHGSSSHSSGHSSSSHSSGHSRSGSRSDHRSSDPAHHSGRSSQSSGSSGNYVRSKRLERYMKNQREGSRVPGGIITIFLAAIVVIFDIFLFVSGMVPQKYIAPIVIVLILIVILVWFLTRNTGKLVRFVIGTVVAVATIVVLLYATVALGNVMNTLKSITETETESSYVGVYVLMEDTAETLEDVADDTFGIVKEADRDVTDLALEQICDELGMDVTTEEYAGPTVLLDGLYGQECRSIVLNEAYIDVLSELDGYEDIEERIRELARFEIVQEVGTEDSSGSTGTAASSGQTFVVYISGVDSRNGLVARSRSDVNILATVNVDTHQILLVTTPRDFYVPLSISNGQRDKLTHAGIYGVQVSMDTLAMLYGVDVDYYFRVSFDGFEDIVDALGGVTVYSDYDFSTGDYSYTVGYNYVDGAAALAFARERYAFADGDRQRGRNQMALISAILDEALSPRILTSYTSVLDAAEDNMEMNIPYDVIADIVSDQLDTGASWDVITYSVDGTGSSAVPYSLSTSAYVMIPDEETVETASEMMQAMLNGERISDPE